MANSVARGQAALPLVLSVIVQLWIELLAIASVRSNGAVGAAQSRTGSVFFRLPDHYILQHVPLLSGEEDLSHDFGAEA